MITTPNLFKRMPHTEEEKMSTQFQQLRTQIGNWYTFSRKRQRLGRSTSKIYSQKKKEYLQMIFFPKMISEDIDKSMT